MYPETADYFWEWDSRENRKRFEDMRIRKDTYENRTMLFVSGMILNRLVSAIEAAYLAKQNTPQTQTKKTYLSVEQNSSGLELNFRYLF